jgi:hypothetical protein
LNGHPAWPNRGAQRIEAFDGIDLVAMQKAVSANRKASPNVALSPRYFMKS